MGFHNELFPLVCDRVWSSPTGDTTIINVGLSGREIRLANWNDGRVEFNAAPGVRSLKDLHALISFQRRRKYRAFSFPVLDTLDHTVAPGTEGAFATGNGSAGPFQLTKTYYDPSNSDVRPITKPKPGTVKVYVGGVLKTEGTHYTLDYVTGRLIFTAGNFPAAGAVLEWEGMFYVPVRFVEDKLPIQEFVANMKYDAALAEWVLKEGAGDIATILLVEDVGA